MSGGLWDRLTALLVTPAGAEDLRWTEAVRDRAARLSGRFTAMDSDEIRASLLALEPTFAASDDQLALFLAGMRELANRTVGLRPFDVQVQAAAAMLRGTSTELATGEGKTLVGAIVAAGLWRAGHRVHVLSANDYLASRDATWMGPLLEAAGATVSAVTSTTSHEVRRAAYAADVVYVPVTEAGFDVLRDRLRTDAADLVGITHDAAVLDEADAVLLDEARVPLVLAGEADEGPASLGALGDAGSLARLAAGLVGAVHYEVDADRRALHLTDEGLRAIERQVPGVDLFGRDHDVLARIHTALSAKALLIRDVDYVVEPGRVRLVSQSRGRVEERQRWPEGLQEAVEAKEQLPRSGGVDILDQLLVADLVALYSPVVGMSATLAAEAEELRELYGLRVGEVPPNRPCVRVDEPDRFHTTRADRDAAALVLTEQAHRRGQPVLVAAQSVAESERFARLLTQRGVDCVVLNAKNDAAEAGIIAQAGQRGSVTVSTQMAGRGTDIHLGQASAELGGLLILGLGRFPSKRLDDQLRGRAGRQGDPGRTMFLTSLEDDLIAEHLPGQPGTAAAGLVDQAQRISDGQQRSLRDLSRRYSRLLNRQRLRILTTRREVMVTDHALALLTDLIPTRIAELGRQVPRDELAGSARIAVLSCLDRRWSDHLAYAAAIREGIHLRALAREEPLHEFTRLIAQAAETIVPDALEEAAAILTRARVVGATLDLAGAGLPRPGATWTYTVTDDHFGTEWERMGKTIMRLLGRSRAEQ